MNKKQLSFGAIGLAVLGLFFPWVSAQTIFGEIHVNGLDTNDGKLALGILVAAMALLWCKYFVPTMILCALGIALSIYDMFDIMGGTDTAKEEGVIVSLGFGIILTLPDSVSHWLRYISTVVRARASCLGRPSASHRP